MLLGIVLEALGDGEAGMMFDPAQAVERRRSALSRMRRGRTWDRRAPDHADEPPDLIWEREAQRRR